jgi:hypothetical protein
VVTNPTGHTHFGRLFVREAACSGSFFFSTLSPLDCFAMEDINDNDEDNQPMS